MRFNIEDENYKYLRESRTSFENNVPILTVTEFEVDRKTSKRSAISRFNLKGLFDFPKFYRNLVMYNKSDNGFRYVFSFCNNKYFIDVYKIDEHTLDWGKNLWNLESVSDYGKGGNNKFKGITEIVTGPKSALEIAQSSLLKCIKYIDNVIDLMEKESGEDDHQEIR